MKKLFCLLAISFIAIKNIHAQVDIINTMLIHPDSNIVFIGIENRFEIIHPGKENYQLQSGKSMVKKTSESNIFIVHVDSPGPDTFFIINNGRRIYKKIFQRVYLPPMKAVLGGINKNLATKEEVIAHKGLFLQVENCKCELRHYITSFVLRLTSTNIKEEDKEIIIQGNLLSEKAISLIRLLTHNDRIEFDKIFAQDIDSNPRIMRSFVITIR